MPSFLTHTARQELEVNMNRRDLIGRALGAVAVATVSGRGVAGNAFTIEPLCNNQMCAHFLESTAKEIMRETGEWKQAILKSRANKRMLITRLGCCGCEITLPKGSNHPDWRYTRRNLTLAERESFNAEYGRQAAFLLGMDMSSTMRIRGFILDGRREGWNLSVRRTNA